MDWPSASARGCFRYRGRDHVGRAGRPRGGIGLDDNRAWDERSDGGISQHRLPRGECPHSGISGRGGREAAVRHQGGPEAADGDPSAKYIKRLIRHCGSTSNYHAVTHPSFPNYLAATSGGLHGGGRMHTYRVRSIFSQVDPSWRSYQEFMPRRCDRDPQVGSPATGHYYVNRHNPAVFYRSSPVHGDCKKFDRPLGTAASGALLRAVKIGKLPRFSLITPGLCNDMHKLPEGVKGCADPTAHGDAWLATWIPIITAGRDYRKGHLVIDIVWDEGNGGKLGAKCLHSSAANCIVANIVISPYTRHKVSSTDFSHYSLLKMTEKLLRVHYLGRAASPGTRNLCRPFGLCPG